LPGIGSRIVFITYPSAVLQRTEDEAEIRSMLVADLRTADAASRENGVKRASGG
jgi:CII-binding regulator of phage lambda lysogenization HflD